MDKFLIRQNNVPIVSPGQNDTNKTGNRNQEQATASTSFKSTETQLTTSSSTSVSTSITSSQSETKEEGRRRHFQSKWQDTFKWLIYDEKVSKAFCDICQNAFLKSKMPNLTKYSKLSIEAFVNQGLDNWKKAIEQDRQDRLYSK